MRKVPGTRTANSVRGEWGSAADVQHLPAELVSRLAFDRPGLPAMALTTDTSILTAVSNDYGIEQVFLRQLEANGRGRRRFGRHQHIKEPVE